MWLSMLIQVLPDGPHVPCRSDIYWNRQPALINSSACAAWHTRSKLELCPKLHCRCKAGALKNDGWKTTIFLLWFGFSLYGDMFIFFGGGIRFINDYRGIVRLVFSFLSHRSLWRFWCLEFFEKSLEVWYLNSWFDLRLTKLVSGDVNLWHSGACFFHLVVLF